MSVSHKKKDLISLESVSGPELTALLDLAA